MSTTVTLEQQRAQHAWNKANEGNSRHKKDYINDAKGLPALIMNRGLMQIMAFMEAKGDRQKLLGQHLRDWLAHQCGTPEAGKDFMTHLFQLDDARRYQHLPTESLAWLRWLRQLAAAIPTTPENKES